MKSGRPALKDPPLRSTVSRFKPDSRKRRKRSVERRTHLGILPTPRGLDYR
jgi:hypothetical protein